MRENSKLVTIMAIFGLAALGLGVFLWLSHGKYATALEEMDSLGKKVSNMEKAPLYPNEANVTQLDEKVTAYEGEVGKLSTVLMKLQPEVKAVTDTDFQSKLKTRIAEIKTQATNRMTLPKDFAFGFDAYTQSLPRSPEAARELGDFFDAVDAVVVSALENDVRSIDKLERSELTVESAAPPPPPPPPPPPSSKSKSKTKSKSGKAVAPPKELAKAVERRELRLTFTGDQKAIMGLSNALASASSMKYFTVARIVRIENEKQEGPSRGPSPAGGGETPVGGGKSTASISPATDTPVAPADGAAPAEGAAPAAPKAEVIEVAKAAPPDATAVMGAEMLKAYFEIDIIRFVEPKPAN